MLNLARRKGGLLSPFLTGRDRKLSAPHPPERPAPEADEPSIDPATRWLPAGLAGTPRSKAEHRSALPSAREVAAAPAQPSDSALRGPLRDDQRVEERHRRWLPESRNPEGPPAATATRDPDPHETQSPRLVADPPSAPSISTDDHPQDERAVRAYCRELCEGASTEQAAGEALARFGAIADEPAALNYHLLRITRVVAAEHVPTVQGPTDLREALAAERDGGCRATTSRLGARANGELDASGQAQLDRHLDRCLRCHATQLKMGRAERAFVMTLAGEVGLADLATAAAAPMR